MAGSSKRAIYGAIIANSLIAICKFIAGGYSHNSTMISEGIHSLVDTGNGVLLLFGIKKSQKPADEKHPFGYGNEIYFWSFVVAVLIFSLGGGIALYEGIQHVLHPKQPDFEYIYLNYIVLILALIFEGSALRVAMKEFNKTRGNLSILQALKESKDTATSAVVIEDTAALLGLTIALIAVALTHLTGNIYIDGLGSIFIGLLLIGVSFFFAIECKDLLVGEGLNRENITKITDILTADKNINEFKRPLTLYFGPEDVLVNLDVNFKDDLNSDEIEVTIDRIEKAIREKLPVVNRIFIEAETIKTSRTKKEV